MGWKLSPSQFALSTSPLARSDSKRGQRVITTLVPSRLASATATATVTAIPSALALALANATAIPIAFAIAIAVAFAAAAQRNLGRWRRSKRNDSSRGCSESPVAPGRGC